MTLGFSVSRSTFCGPIILNWTARRAVLWAANDCIVTRRLMLVSVKNFFLKSVALARSPQTLRGYKVKKEADEEQPE